MREAMVCWRFEHHNTTLEISMLAGCSERTVYEVLTTRRNLSNRVALMWLFGDNWRHCQRERYFGAFCQKKELQFLLQSTVMRTTEDLARQASTETDPDHQHPRSGIGCAPSSGNKRFSSTLQRVPFKLSFRCLKYAKPAKSIGDFPDAHQMTLRSPWTSFGSKSDKFEVATKMFAQRGRIRLQESVVDSTELEAAVFGWIVYMNSRTNLLSWGYLVTCVSSCRTGLHHHG